MRTSPTIHRQVTSLHMIIRMTNSQSAGEGESEHLSLYHSNTHFYVLIQPLKIMDYEKHFSGYQSLHGVIACQIY